MYHKFRICLRGRDQPEHPDQNRGQDLSDDDNEIDAPYTLLPDSDSEPECPGISCNSADDSEQEAQEEEEDTAHQSDKDFLDDADADENTSDSAQDNSNLSESDDELLEDAEDQRKKRHNARLARVLWRPNRTRNIPLEGIDDLENDLERAMEGQQHTGYDGDDDMGDENLDDEDNHK